MQFQKITILGVGLLGGSIGLAVKRGKLAREVAGFVRRAASVKECEQAGAIDFATTDLFAAVSNADLIILCTPLAQMRPLVNQMFPALKRGAIVTDVGSVKAGVVHELESFIQKSGAHFVGSHPMAGAEKTGVRDGFDLVFAGDVLVHTLYPLKALAALAPLCRDTLVLAQMLPEGPQDPPAMAYTGGGDPEEDHISWWLPNKSCLVQMLLKLGFATVEEVGWHTGILRPGGYPFRRVILRARKPPL